MKLNLKGIRATLGLTQKEMGEAVGVSEDTWRNYEKYKTYPDVLIVNRIEEVSGVNYNDINFLPPNYGLTVKVKKPQAIA